jgi:RNA polymerase sporulation-specific sigma factor
MEAVLTEKEKTVIRMRYGLGNREEYTQREIAEQLHISRSYVSRIEKGALEKMRAYME